MEKDANRLGLVELLFAECANAAVSALNVYLGGAEVGVFSRHIATASAGVEQAVLCTAHEGHIPNPVIAYFQFHSPRRRVSGRPCGTPTPILLHLDALVPRLRHRDEIQRDTRGIYVARPGRVVDRRGNEQGSLGLA
ncbi:hypothetical protein GY45DRAFT_465312 [Cubamyces sp. BRFM 1775]|nr:hypothetical protein GY45DRAFT_465312 [Cubamyces sp. BRFM 1775]